MQTKTIRVHLALSLAMLATFTGAVSAREAPAAPVEAAVIMPMAEIRPGMKGYGMTVFRGVDIEPFAVEVISVMHSDYLSGPQRSIIWIRCPDERMKESGPVSGMSGSPIYLWDEGETHELGRGGRLIGAFAYGFGGSKECYVGVQPIELMRDVAERIDAAGAAPTDQASSAQTIGRQLRQWSAIARQLDPGADQAWRIDALAALFGKPAGEGPQSSQAAGVPFPEQLQGSPTRLFLPLTLRSPALANAVRPMLAPLGLTAMAGNGVAGSPPPWIKPEDVSLSPGSVLSIPLAFGDLDIAAIGTVTEVLADGTVLAFGHGMNSRGQLTLPMASGHVHFILPGLTGSFKVGGSVALAGGMVRDENSAVAGRPGAEFAVAPLVTSVQLPEQPRRQYNLKVARDRDYTPIIAAIASAETLVAVQTLPAENTLRITGSIRLEGGRVINLDNLVPNGSPISVLLAVAPPLMAMANNPFQSVMLEALDLKMEVVEEIRLGSIVQGRIDRSYARPGEDLLITLALQQPGQGRFNKQIRFTLPQSLAEGTYEVAVCDAQSYLGRMLANRPYLAQTGTIDELFEVVKLVMEMRSDALYVMLNLPQSGLAVERREMPMLPSSRQAMIAAPTHTMATPYRQWIEKVVPMDVATAGEVSFMVNVSKTLVDR